MGESPAEGGLPEQATRVSIAKMQNHSRAVINLAQGAPLPRVRPTIGASAAGGSSYTPNYSAQPTETEPTPMRGLIDRQLHARVGQPISGLRP